MNYLINIIAKIKLYFKGINTGIMLFWLTRNPDTNIKIPNIIGVITRATFLFGDIAPIRNPKPVIHHISR